MLGKHELKWRVARFLREGRKAKGLTLNDTSKLTRISKSRISRLERAEVVKLDFYEIVLLASLYEISLLDIAGTP